MKTAVILCGAVVASIVLAVGMVGQAIITAASSSLLPPLEASTPILAANEASLLADDQSETVNIQVHEDKKHPSLTINDEKYHAWKLQDATKSLPIHPATGKPLPSECTAPPRNNNAFLTHDDVVQVISAYFQERDGPRVFIPMLLTNLHLYARSNQKQFWTLQLGGMDGRSGDPMFKGVRRVPTLEHWMPIVVEPSDNSFNALIDTYDGLQKRKHVPCPLLLRQAVSYQDSCSFCGVNATLCNSLPEWLQSQTNSLDCESLKYRMKSFPAECVVQQELECVGVLQTLRNWGIRDMSKISFLQLDIEGHEYPVLQGMFAELLQEDYVTAPTIIHFESKVLRKKQLLEPLLDLLYSKGYIFSQTNGVDTLVMRIPNATMALLKPGG